MSTTGVRHGHWQWKTSEGLRTGLRAFLSLLLFSPMNVALSGLSVLAISFLLYNIPIHPMLLSAAFLVTFSIYTLNIATDKREDTVNSPERARYFITDTRLLVAIAFGCYFAATIIGGLVSLTIIPVLCIPLTLGLLYSMGIRSVRLKDVLIGKNTTVSLSWALVASLLPAVFVVRTPVILLILSFIFVKGLINTILFDVRDIHGDSTVHVSTLPSIVGIPATRILLLGLNSLLLIWLMFAVQQTTFLFYLPVFVFCLAYGYFYIFYLARDISVPKVHYGLLLDGEWMLLLALFLLSLWIL